MARARSTVVVAEAVGLDEGQEAAFEEVAAYLPPQAETELALSGQHISVSFGGVNALEDVSLEVPSRAFVGLMGPNGAGKSTLFDVLNGFTVPVQGEVVLFDQNVSKLPPWDRARLGMSRTFQANHIDPDLTVHANLLSGAYRLIRGGLLAATIRTRSNSIDERRARGTARAVARALGLERFGNARAGSLDFGAQRRVEIGRSLMSGPRLLLLDEPTAGVDVHEAGQLMGLVKQLQVRLGLTVLLIEHYVRAVLDNSDLVYALDQGEIIAVGTSDEIAGNAAVKAAYLGE